jgi:hypothetical protein
MTAWGVHLIPCLAMTAGLLAAPLAASQTASPTAAEPTPDPLRLQPVGGVRALDVPLTADRLGQPLRTSEFDLVGLTWRGRADDARIRIRVRTDAGWGPWRVTTPMSDGPDSASPERSKVRGSDLLWAGGADRVEIAVTGRRPDNLTLALIDVPRGGSAHARVAAVPRARNELRPRLLGRKRWGADPALRDGRPSYNRTIQQVHVHHTVNSNGYSRRDVPGLIRGMYRYHTVNLGWSDIGYNFLVDRFGRTWTGRAGGARRPVRGAHTLGFNSTSTGVAVIGNFERTRPSPRVLTALVHLSAWKLNKYDRNPRGRVRVYSHGSDLYPAGRTVTLPVIDGHRDTNQTACPGARLYDRLPGIRRRAADRIARFR